MAAQCVPPRDVAMYTLLALFYLFSHAIVFLIFFFQPFNSTSVLFPFSLSPPFFLLYIFCNFFFFFIPEAAFNLRHFCYLGQIVCVLAVCCVCRCVSVYVCMYVCADQADCDRWLVFTFASFCSLFFFSPLFSWLWFCAFICAAPALPNYRPAARLRLRIPLF